MDNQQDVILKISATGHAKSVAGAMSWRLREEGFCKARAIKQDAVNTATKAIAICNQRVIEAGMQFCMDLFFSKAENPTKEEDKTATAIEMTISEMVATKPENFLEYRVSGKQDQEKNSAMKLAEALAAPVKEGKGVVMKCIGPAAVYRAILACTIARGLIYPNGYETIVIPSWDSIPQENLPPISLIKIEFFGRKL